MSADIANLIKLQSIDLRIHELEQSKIDLPIAASDREATIQKSQGGVDAVKAKIATAQAEMKAITDSIGQSNDLLSRSQERLNNIKTNREYDAVHAEIESNKSSVSSNEQRLTSINKEIENLNTLAGQAQEALDGVKAELEPQIADLRARIATIDSNIAKIVVERDEVTPVLPKHFLSAYEFIQKRRRKGRSQVLSLVTETRTCGVCHKKLEPQLINDIRKGVKIPTCQSCGSMLVWNVAEMGQPVDTSSGIADL
jgi:hypothetical protein